MTTANSEAVLEDEVEIDEESAQILAKMDARGVTGAKLQAVFQCGAEELTLCRNAGAYKDAYAAEVLAIEQRAMTLDDTWDEVEAKALGDLKEQMTLGAVVDPRQLLGLAATSNKMSRRSAAQSASGLERGKAEAARPVLDASSTVVIRLRTRFVEKLDTPAGHARLLEREETVIQHGGGNLVDEVTPTELRKHISEGLGIDLNDLKTGGSRRPDDAIEALMRSGGNAGGLPTDMFYDVSLDAEVD